MFKIKIIHIISIFPFMYFLMTIFINKLLLQIKYKIQSNLLLQHLNYWWQPVVRQTSCHLGGLFG